MFPQALKMTVSNFTMAMQDFTLDWSYSSDYANYTTDIYPINEEDEVVLPSQEEGRICSGDALCIVLLVVNVIIIVLGVVGNAVVIWIAGFRMKKTVNTTWYLSLALSDFIFCASLPINTIYMATSDWTFGRFMCKFTSFVMFLNMFSSIFLLVIISVDRCVAVMFPVWAQNQRTKRKACFAVVLAWVASVALAIPSMIFRDVSHYLGRNLCFNNYPDQHTHNSIIMSRFVFGFLIPFLFIVISYLIIIFKLKNNQMAKSNKPFKIMTALIVTFFLCWLPYQMFVLFERYHVLPHNILVLGLKLGTSVASANSFLNPILYVFMGNDFRRTVKSSLLSKIENAMGEEGRTLSRYLSRSSSVDARTSTHI